MKTERTPQVRRPPWATPALLLVVFLFSGSPVLRADRSANWRMFKAGDGLPENDVLAVTVSPKGHVWVKHGNADEIARLDGFNIQTYPSPSSGNYRVYERTGQLWSLYSEGLLVFIEASRQWIRRPVPEIRAEIQSDIRRQVRQIPLLPAERNRVLFLLSDKLMEYDLATRRAVLIKHVSETGLGRFLEMTECRQGGLWITGTKGLARFSGALRHLRSNGTWQEFLTESVHVENLQRPFEDDHGGITVVGSDTTVSSTRVVLHFDGKAWTARPVEGFRVSQAWPGWDNITWGLTVNALLRFDPLPQTNISREKIWAGQYRDVATETNSAFWLATSEGLFRYAPHLWRAPASLEELNSEVHAILQDREDRLWCASADSLLRYQDGAWNMIKWPEDSDGSFETGDRLYALPDGRLFITAGERILLFDPASVQFQVLPQGAGRRLKVLGQLNDQSVVVQAFSIEATAKTGFELERFDGVKLEPFLRAPADWSFGEELFFVAPEANGDLWLGGTGGLARYRNCEFESFGIAQGFRGARALWLAPGAGGRLWCGTTDRIYEFTGKSWILLRAGLDRISGVARGQDERVWIATAQGLICYLKNSWLDHGMEEGLPSPQVSKVLVDRRGRVWAGTKRGLSLYHPDADPFPPKSLPPILENAGGRVLDEKAIVLLNGVDRWEQTMGDRLLFATRLDGRDWSAYTNTMVMSFDRLAPGKHHLEVRAMDRNGNDDPDFATLTFSVVVAWYRDPRLVSIVLLGAILVVFFASLAVNRHLQLIRSYAEVERIVAIRTQELERANQELLHSQKMRALGTLAAGIAHDFNNILSIIKGSAQIIETNLEDRQKILTRLSRIQAVVEQGSGIVKSILGLSRVKQKDLALGDLNSVVEATTKLVGDRFLHEVQVEFRPTPALPPVHMVKELIQQMLLNLILNAADAMDQRGRIQLSTWQVESLASNLALSPAPAERYVGVSVQDEGIGMAPEILPRIFEPFFTTKALSTRRGTGLGLSIVYELARELGYGIEVQSELGKGSTFSILVPVRET